ncbi:hypothetical protein ABVT39_015645 [Epinephelus coioides]
MVLSHRLVGPAPSRTSRPPPMCQSSGAFSVFINYSHQFIEDYAEIAKPFTELLRKDKHYTWGEPQEQSFRLMKEKLCTAPCLAYPDKDKEFQLEASFSPHCLSAALAQRYDTDKWVVAYASRPLSNVEVKFSDCEKVLLATVWAVEHFRSYIGGQKEHLRATFALAQKNLEASVKGAKAYYDRSASHRDYQIGDKVFYFRFAKPAGISKKFLPSSPGPFEIVGKLSPVAYRIRISKPKQAPSDTGTSYHPLWHTQRIYVCLDPWDVYRNHIRLSPKLTEGWLRGIQMQDTIEHAKQAMVHILQQLEKFLVTEKDLSDKKRPKRFLGALLAAAAGVGSLFSIGLSIGLIPLQQTGHMSSHMRLK